jgi:hypothetical protein
MAKLLDSILPQATPEYKQSMLDQLVKKLQLVLGINVQTQDEASEVEAVNYFLSN